MMTFHLNDESIDFNSTDLSLTQLMEQHQLMDKKGLAVAINETVIRKEDWANQRIQNNDKIIIITATQGG